MSSLYLSQRPGVRYVTGALMYFAQGIPHGLLTIALPAWLVSEGASAGQIGSYLAIIMLPWAFKLVTGPLMERFEFLPMGRRRPWVLGAQAGLCLALLALGLVDNPIQQMGLLTAIGFLINSFAATQDVAVDGMAIDVTPMEQQGRLNAFMSFGKAIGWSATAAVSGVLLANLGLATTAMVAAGVSVLGVLLMLAIREREGERFLPWTAGQPSRVLRAEASFRAVRIALNHVLWTRTSLIVMGVMFFDGLIYGYGQALMPIAAVNLFGYASAEWSQLVAVMGLVGAVITVGLGPLIDRAGAKRMLVFTIALVGIHAFTLAQTQHLWENTLYVRSMLSIYVAMLPIVMVASLALAMAICSGPVSATQFAIYMSVANLGHTVGAKVYGVVAEQSGYVQAYTVLSVLVIAMILVLVFYRQAPPDDRKANPRKRHAIVAVPGGAVAFWSSAIRCPKCRTPMDQVTYDGVEVDRCQHCQGIWFDAGEIKALSTRDAAEELDIGSSTIGHWQDGLQDYDCPRCGGPMQKAQVKRQPHIRIETCVDCKGSFLDAGELKDLTELTAGEFLRSLMPLGNNRNHRNHRK